MEKNSLLVNDLQKIHLSLTTNSRNSHHCVSPSLVLKIDTSNAKYATEVRGYILMRNCLTENKQYNQYINSVEVITNV